MIVKGRKVRGLTFIAGFVMTILFYVIVFDFVQIEFTDELWTLVVGLALFSGTLMFLNKKGIFHEGHFSIVVGMLFIVTGILMFYGTFSFNYVDDNGVIQTKEQLWSLSNQQSGAFILLAGIGVWSLLGGVRQMMGYSYLWGIKRGR